MSDAYYRMNDNRIIYMNFIMILNFPCVLTLNPI